VTLLAAVGFRKVGKLQYYAADSLPLRVGAFVVAETQRGVQYGEVKILRDVDGDPEDLDSAYRLLRLATPDDSSNWEGRQKQAEESIETCQTHADTLSLPMKVVDSEMAIDGSQVTFYFVADNRIDFRELVKAVASRMRMRVHLHQVGSRDHAKALGGYGPCGRPLCCTTFLRDFAPVSMKMAKDQSLYLNPSKFSGVCGKLMCCLRYEHDVYMEAKDRIPPLGTPVTCPDGTHGIVTEMNILQEIVTVRIHDDDIIRFMTMRAAEVTIAGACGDCGSVGGGCGGTCAAGGCGVTAKADVMPSVISLERWRRNWN